VTLVTQYQSEFELHLRAILGWKINKAQEYVGASHVILSDTTCSEPTYTGIDKAVENSCVNVRIFGKSDAYPKRRMGVVLVRRPHHKNFHPSKVAKNVASGIKIKMDLSINRDLDVKGTITGKLFQGFPPKSTITNEQISQIDSSDDLYETSSTDSENCAASVTTYSNVDDFDDPKGGYSSAYKVIRF
jgi:hypothetical protein